MSSYSRRVSGCIVSRRVLLVRAWDRASLISYHETDERPTAARYSVDPTFQPACWSWTSVPFHVMAFKCSYTAFIHFDIPHSAKFNRQATARELAKRSGVASTRPSNKRPRHLHGLIGLFGTRMHFISVHLSGDSTVPPGGRGRNLLISQICFRQLQYNRIRGFAL